ncbi:MAG: hypothetical protein ACRDZ4_07670 [Egibacteraceae bacterium]
MAPVSVEIQASRVDSDEIELVTDLDELVESSRCSCNAGDDNPY